MQQHALLMLQHLLIVDYVTAFVGNSSIVAYVQHNLLNMHRHVLLMLQHLLIMLQNLLKIHQQLIICNNIC
jgi:hypothetical protein